MRADSKPTFTTDSGAYTDNAASGRYTECAWLQGKYEAGS